jgi:(p)ppGpp synthase/HD superfamily hydrolase
MRPALRVHQAPDCISSLSTVGSGTEGFDISRAFEYAPAMSRSIAGDILAAAHFAACKHKGQCRREGEATPYINHPLAVAERLARIAGVKDITTIQAALLHDTIEDTRTTGEELETQFGKEVRHLVEELTDDMSLPWNERKRIQVEHASKLSPRARLIKLADKICNLEDLTPTSPVGWSVERKREYLEWGENVVAEIRGSNPELEKHFDETLSKKRSMLGL